MEFKPDNGRLIVCSFNFCIYRVHCMWIQGWCCVRVCMGRFTPRNLYQWVIFGFDGLIHFISAKRNHSITSERPSGFLCDNFLNWPTSACGVCNFCEWKAFMFIFILHFNSEFSVRMWIQDFALELLPGFLTDFDEIAQGQSAGSRDCPCDSRIWKFQSVAMEIKKFSHG